MRRLSLAVLAAGLIAAPAAAATRGFTVTDFDRVRLSGPYSVELRTGGSPSARAEGPQDVLDRLRIDNQGRTLVVQPDRTGSAPRSREAVRIVLTTPALVGASLTGSGDLAIDRVRAARFDLSMTGAGAVTLGRIETDRLLVTLAGAGGATIAGKAASARIVLQGAGGLKADALSVAEAELVASGAANATLGVTRTARIDASGASDVTILGSPACQVTQSGAGDVRCGRDRPR